MLTRRTYPAAALTVAESKCPRTIIGKSLRGAWCKGYVDGQRRNDVDPYRSPTRALTGWSYVHSQQWRAGHRAGQAGA